MTHESYLRTRFAGLHVNDSFTEAVVTMSDGSRLCFCHRVGERRARAEGGGAAEAVLATIHHFRLNGKHLDVAFQDGSHWEARFPH